MPRSIGHILKSAIRVVTQVNREKATGLIEFEVKELENIFALLILGGFAGLPSPPSPIAIELLPYMETMLEAFGPRRTMFGSDWPVCLVACDYDRWAGIVKRCVSRLSATEQARVLGGTAVEAYGLG